MLVMKLLGQFNVQLDDQLIEVLSRPAQTLMAYLVLHPGTAFRREMLAGLIWPEATESNARSNLRHALWRIRKALGEQAAQDYFLADDFTVTFNPDPGCWIDAVLLSSKPGPTTPTLEEQVAAYQGELLPGFYDDWISLERERLQAAFEGKIETLIDRLSNEKHWPDVIEWAEHWIKLSAAPEPAYRALMLAHARSGHKAKVKEAYQRCVEALQREFGVEPSEETQELYQQLISTRPLTQPAAVEPAAAPRHNLPAPVTPLIGRETELAEITDRLVNDPGCRLLTIVGPGGIGKTRLALQAATQTLEYFGDGTYFVSFEAITAPEAIAPAILQTLSPVVQDQKDQTAQLIDYLRDKHVLLILDNLEHLLEGAAVIGAVLSVAPDVKIVVTSRERLHLQWEWLYEVQGLSYPSESVEAAEEYSAVQLFLQTARRMRARFSPAEELPHVIRICQLVEGLPLGLELAASWVRVMSCQEIAQQIERNLDLLAARVQDIPDRHRSARAVFEYSWSLLAHEEQGVLMKLAVFPGGFRREAAEKVAGAPLSLLFTLADKSLLRVNTAGRYDMHSLLRQYVSEKLSHSGQSPGLQTRLITYYLDFAQQHQHDYTVLEEEHINVMTCLEAAYRNWQAQLVLKYVDALGEMWSARGRWSDARKGYAWACDAAQAHDDDRALAHYLRRGGQACIEQGDYSEAEVLLTHSLELCQRHGDRQGIAYAQYELARIALERADLEHAEQWLTSSRALFEELQDTAGTAETLYRMAWLHYYYNRFDQAEQAARQSLLLHERVNNTRRCIPPLRLLADLAVHVKRDYASAEQSCLRAIELCHKAHEDYERAAVLDTLAETHRLQGKLAQAHAEAIQGLELFRLAGDRKLQAHLLFRLSKIDFDLGNLRLALEQGLQSLELCRELDDPWGAVYVQEHLGNVYVGLNQIEQARRIWAEALNAAEQLHHPLAAILKQHAEA